MINQFRPGFLLLFVFISIRSAAQIVSTESAKMETDTTGWMGNAHLSLGLTQSVERILSADMGLHFQYKSKKHLWILLGNYNFLKGANNKYVDARFFHLRYDFKMKRRMHWESFFQAENNLVAGLRHRFIVGTGPRIKIFSNKFIHLHAASDLTYEWEKESPLPGTFHHGLRSSSYFSFVMTPNDRVEFACTTFFQPLFSDFSDIRILNQASLKVKASKHFSMSMRWNYFNDPYPVGTTPESLYSLGAGFEYDF